MKRLSVLCLIIFSLKSYAQSAIASFPMQITFYKTSNIIFPYEIISVDRGSRDVLAQKAKGVDNVLQLKAARENFVETNLSVIVADGKLYSFNLNYATNPAILNMSFQKDTQIQLSRNPINAAFLDSVSLKMMKQKQFLHISSKNEGMKFTLQSTYIDNGLLWFSFSLKNHSLIEYKPDHLKFLLHDRKKVARTSSQEKEIIPNYQFAPLWIPGNAKKELLFAFTAFTIPKSQILVVELGEKSGGRQLSLDISHTAVLKSRLVN